ncbi:MAG: nicotinate-nucleotide adenylyltransferase [Pseudomonadota bacterium]
MICCFGGTFDPVHIGHLAGARRVADVLDLPVRMVLSARPSHRDQPGATIDERLAMLDIACAPWPALTPDAREARRDGPSYTVHTLEALRMQHPREAIGWVIGRDTLLTLDTWFEWQRVFELAHLIVLDRVGFEGALPAAVAAEIREQTEARMPVAPSGAVIHLPGALPAVSATEVRRRLATGEPVAHWLPTGVFQFLRRRKIYGGMCDA